MAATELKLPFVAALPFDGYEKVWPEKTQYFYRALLGKGIGCSYYTIRRFQF
jgi:hypothetical protein